MTARTTYESTVTAAGPTQLTANFTAEQVFQAAGATPAGGVVRLASRFANEAAKQATLAVARDTLRDGGDRAAV